jgi:hypothetical protein
MDLYNKIELHGQDSTLFNNVIIEIHLLQKAIDSLEYTGDFHSNDQETCEQYINSLRNILMKKLYETQ